MARKTKAEAQETRRQILDAAELVFQAKGVSQTSLNDIAQAAGMTRGAIYWHFKNKVDLFNQMHERIHMPIENLAEDLARRDEPDPLGRLQSLCVNVLQETVSNPHQRRVLDVLFQRCEMIEEMGDLVARQTQILHDAINRTERSFRNAKALGQLPATLNARKASVSLNAYVRGLLTTWLLAPDSFDLHADAQDLMASYFDMLRGPSALND